MTSESAEVYRTNHEPILQQGDQDIRLWSFQLMTLGSVASE